MSEPDNRHHYVAPFSLPTRILIPAVGEVTDALNENMAGFGFDEKVEAISTIELVLSNNGPLPAVTLEKARELALESARKAYPGCYFRVGPFHLKG